MNGKRIGAILSIIGASLALSACQTTGGPTGTTAWDPHARAEVEGQLGQAANRAAAALETLAMIERTRTEPPPSPVDEMQLPPELQRPMTVNWPGPAEDLARQIAGTIGYSFVVLGNPPSVSPKVQIAARDLPVAKVLESIGLQIQKAATLVVDPNTARIELRYADVADPNAPQAHKEAPRRRTGSGSRSGK